MKSELVEIPRKEWRFLRFTPDLSGAYIPLEERAWIVRWWRIALGRFHDKVKGPWGFVRFGGAVVLHVGDFELWIRT